MENTKEKNIYIDKKIETLRTKLKKKIKKQIKKETQTNK